MGIRYCGHCLILMSALLGACSPSKTEAASWPTGTVLVLNDVPVLEADVDLHTEALLDIKPSFSEIHRRRLVALHWALPMAYGHSLAGSAREEARRTGEAWLEARATEPPAPLVRREEDLVGNWDILGLDNWLIARDLEAGDSTGLVELPGRFAVIDLVARDGNKLPALEQFVLRIESFDYVEDPGALVLDLQQGNLEIVDPAWREIIPGIYKYKMQAQGVEQ